MPYASDKDLPSGVKDNLPRHARRIYRSAFNSAYAQYHADDKAAATAWAAVKSKYKKGDDGKWHLKKGADVVDLVKNDGGQWTMPVLLEKMEEKADGTLMVYGYGVEEAPDKGGEVLDWDWSLPHFDKWSKAIYDMSGGKSLGNVRQMHSLKAVGSLAVYEPKPDIRKIWMGAHIVEPTAVMLTKSGVFNGFSVGGKKGKQEKRADGFTWYEGIPSEMSIVDNPMMYGAKFAYVKADGSQELRKFVQGGQQVVEVAALPATTSIGGIEDMDEQALRKFIEDELKKKSAPDHEKIVTLIQDLRNQAELDGDTDGASLYTQAIALVLQASGEEKSEPLAEQAAEGEGDGATGQAAPASGDGEAAPASDGDGTVAAADKATTLKKVGRTFSGANAQAMHNVIRTLAAMLAATGDDTAAKVAALYSAPAEKVLGLDGLAKAADLTKAVGEMAKAGDVQKLLGDIGKMLAELEHLDKRLSKVEATPVAAGPALRELPGADESVLAGLLAKVTDPTARQAIEQQLSLTAIRAAQQSGTVISPR